MKERYRNDSCCVNIRHTASLIDSLYYSTRFDSSEIVFDSRDCWRKHLWMSIPLDVNTFGEVIRVRMGNNNLQGRRITGGEEC